jgi:tetratricopeptide (TPR) repeat protein
MYPKKQFMPRILISVLLIFTSLSVLAQSAESFYQQGVKYYADRQYSKAVEYFQKALAPASAEKFTPAKGKYAEYLNASYNKFKMVI